MCYNTKSIAVGFIIEFFRSSRPEVFLEKDVLKICSRFTGEHPCRSAISIKLQATLFKSASEESIQAIPKYQIQKESKQALPMY